MSRSNWYAEELQAINAVHRGTRHGFRTTDVICVDRFDRTITFSQPQAIAREMARLIDAFAAEFEHAADVSSLALAFARFYYAFIAIHPFRDANRRTAFTFLEDRAREKSFRIESIDVLRRVLLEGAVAEEMQKLRSLFITMIKPENERN